MLLEWRKSGNETMPHMDQCCCASSHFQDTPKTVTSIANELPPTSLLARDHNHLDSHHPPIEHKIDTHRSIDLPLHRVHLFGSKTEPAPTSINSHPNTSPPESLRVLP
jgi:hypothetical protein